MKTSARVVVIGGGVVGVSTLYHLAKKGWSDVVLVERTELTAGSTWHAAGLLPLFNLSYTVGQIHKYSVDLYKKLEEETGQAVSFHVTGNLRLATTKDRMDEYKKYCGTANTIGVPFEMITPDEVKKLWPLCNTDDLIGALYHPQDGHIAPVDLTNALAKGAKDRGAEIYRQTEVTQINQKKNGEWEVVTNKGTITCEHVVTATGNYARQTGKMVGLDIPAIPVEHQFIVTEECKELREYRESGGKELAVLRDSDHSYYFREEKMGWILGPYEAGAPARFADGVPEDFGQDLFPGDLERLMPHVEALIKRVPSFETTGIQNIINGPISYSPDGNPMIGPAWGLKNFWLNEAHSFGITAAGGAGWQLAEWIIEGEPTIDMLGTDPRRFGAYAGKRYTIEKNEETYRNVFTVHYPNEERVDCRPLKTFPAYTRLDDNWGAVWGHRYGWERPNWFAPKGVEKKDVWSFRRTNYFEHVGNECRTMRERVGLLDLTPFTKHFIQGEGAEAFLNYITANKVPKKIGRITLAHALTKNGTVRSEFTITKLADNKYYVVSSGGAERYDNDYLLKMMPTDGSVTIQNATTSMGTIVVAGPKSRETLKKLTDTDLSNDAFPWLTSQTIDVGWAPNIIAMRVNFIGELGWELHHPIEYQLHIFDKLVEAGKEFDIGMVGMRAMDSLRIEKSYRMWGTDLSTEYSIYDSGLDRFVRMNKDDFIGKSALEKYERVFSFITVEVKNITDADPLGNEPFFVDGVIVGRATAGAHGHCIDKTLALGYIKKEHATIGTEIEIEILGEKKTAVIIEESPYDPENKSLQS